jgi:hypothetical protein
MLQEQAVLLESFATKCEEDREPKESTLIFGRSSIKGFFLIRGALLFKGFNHHKRSLCNKDAHRCPKSLKVAIGERQNTYHSENCK